MDEILTELEDLRANTPQDLCKILECRNAALTGRAITVSALERTESRGSHYRSDYPEENQDWIKRIHVKMAQGLPEVARLSPVDTS